MKHINEIAKERMVSRIIELFLPETYEFDSIRDFEENQESIRSSRKILPLGVFFHGKSLLTFNGRYKFSFDKEDSPKAYLSDLEDSLSIGFAEGFMSLDKAEKENA